ncbi:phage tail assembly protein [Pseudoflavonifractor phocaeensis]|uniref:phage tail assembly protein n=1 Tax=Pseudoflavonifractor phocaeensis TaxID=1870988 RepID=UPI00195CD2C1|nr:phage tail assembly protein [Pseudoflavonifractor phocaeensis]MBM6924804.1 phage tail assembly protein [Pseudoflavonifractor phocaeensis]
MTTVYEFELPKGYVDSVGEVHKRGKMRLATAGDEISATRDPRVLANPSYLTVVILAKVIVELEGMETIVPNIVERFFTADLAFLQDMYQRINDVEPPVMKAVCPDCGKTFEVPINFTPEG